MARSRHVLPPKPRILHGAMRDLDLGLLDVSNHGRPLDLTKPLGEEIIQEYAIHALSIAVLYGRRVPATSTGARLPELWLGFFVSLTGT